MEKQKSILEQRLEKTNPRLLARLNENIEKLEREATIRRRAATEAEIISAEDLAVVVNVRAEDAFVGV